MRRSPVILFRTTGGRQTGLGHIRRCISLAEALRDLGIESSFLLDGDGVAASVGQAGFPVVDISPESDPDETIRRIRGSGARAVVVDSYRSTAAYFRSLSETGALTVAIDDLADRELPVDAVVNGSVGAEELSYRVPHGSHLLLGTSYVLLRKEFAAEPVRRAPPEGRRVLVSVGGSDPYRLTPRLVRWVLEAVGAARAEVVLGPLFGESGELESYARHDPKAVRLHWAPEGMRDLMLACDVAVCGGGQTAYELAATATPAVAVRTAENQTSNLLGLAAAGTLIWVGDAWGSGLEETVRGAVLGLMGNRVRRAEMGRRGRSLVDGQGARRVASTILSLMREDHS